MITLFDIIDFIKSNEDISVKLNSTSLHHLQVSTVSNLIEDNQDPTVLFWVNEKNLQKIEKLNTGILISPKEVTNSFKGVTIISKNPKYTFSSIIKRFFQPVLDTETSVGQGTIIDDNVIIGNNVKIGYNNVIYAGTVIKDNVTIGSNNTIGGVGFGYAKNKLGEWEVVPHIGGVLIEENVEIGNNTCIDRAVLGNTHLQKNCKIDNLVHIAHGAVIGENSLIIANAVVAGSVVIGANTWIAPSTTIINGSTVGSNSMTGLGSVVISNIGDSELFVGVPAKKIKDL